MLEVLARANILERPGSSNVLSWVVATLYTYRDPLKCGEGILVCLCCIVRWLWECVGDLVDAYPHSSSLFLCSRIAFLCFSVVRSAYFLARSFRSFISSRSSAWSVTFFLFCSLLLSSTFISSLASLRLLAVRSANCAALAFLLAVSLCLGHTSSHSGACVGARARNQHPCSARCAPSPSSP